MGANKLAPLSVTTISSAISGSSTLKHRLELLAVKKSIARRDISWNWAGGGEDVVTGMEYSSRALCYMQNI